MTVYCQDVNSGTIVAICRNFPDPPADSPDLAKDFDQLAQTAVVKGISLAQLGTGQLLIQGGKRTPNYQFLPGRSPISFNPQAYQWETLRSPTLAEDFAELSNRLSALPPMSLRPRRLTDNLYVCKVATVEQANFNPIDQTVQATLRDRQGNRITLIHPFTNRGRIGTETLLATLIQQPEAVKFVAGQVRLSGQGFVIAPISVIVQQSTSRMMLQPWISSHWVADANRTALSAAPAHLSLPPHFRYLQELTHALSERWMLGLQRVDSQTLRYWQELERQGAAFGFVRLLKPIRQFTTALTESAAYPNQTAIQALLTIALLVKLAQEQFSAD